MSGLLPRNTTTQTNGNFTDLTVNTLKVSTIAVLASADIQNLSIGSITLPSLSLDNSTTNILGLSSGNQLVYKNNVMDLSSAQTITGVKTFTVAPVISTITNTGTLTLPTNTGTLALVSQIPSPASFVDLTSAQTISGIKTFSASPSIDSVTNGGRTYYFSDFNGGPLLTSITAIANFVSINNPDTINAVKTFAVAPVISTITNTGTLTLPTTTGTLALTSQIPTNTTYVDLTTTQTITGAKTFTTAPVISTITNTGTLTLPTTTGTLALTTDITSALTNYVTLSSAQSITGVKTFSVAPSIASVTNAGKTYNFADINGGTLMTTTTAVSNFVSLNNPDTILAVKTFAVAPVISTITNTGTLTLPTTTGTLALTSQIPTNTTYVDLTTTQTITGAKTFSTAPVISTITNTGTLTLPTTTGTLALTSQIPTNTTYVDLTTTQTITGAKTYTTAPVISTITNTGTLTLPTTTDTLVGRATTDTLTNKTINSASNTITITSGSLSNTNINSVVNQPLLTTSTVTHGSVSVSGGLLSVTNSNINAVTITNNALGIGNLLSMNQQAATIRCTMEFNEQGVQRGLIGSDGSGNISLNAVTGALSLSTANTSRINIPSTGIANDNTITNMLGLNGTTLSFKNNVVDTSTAQTLTTKTIVIDNQTSLISTRAFGAMGNTTPSAINLVVAANTLTLSTLVMTAYSTAQRNATVTGGNTLNDTTTTLNKLYMLSYSFSGSYSVNNQTVIAAIYNGGVQVPGSLAYSSAGNSGNSACVSKSNITFTASGAQSFQLYVGLVTAGTITQQFGHVSFQTIN